MGRRRTKEPEIGQSILTEELVLKSLSIYGKPMRLESIARQVVHIEKRLGQDSTIYWAAIESMLNSLVAAGRIQSKSITVVDDFLGAHFRPLKSICEVPHYFLGPLERLSLV